MEDDGPSNTHGYSACRASILPSEEFFRRACSKSQLSLQRYPSTEFQRGAYSRNDSIGTQAAVSRPNRLFAIWGSSQPLRPKRQPVLSRSAILGSKTLSI